MKTRIILPVILFIILAFILIHTLLVNQQDADRTEWISPYKDIDWDNVIHAKAQLHTHTTCSDGLLNPQSVVDLYKERNYAILAITDHWNVTWPWQDFTSFQPSDRTLKRFEEGEFRGLSREALYDFENRDPESLGMFAVKASEPSFTGKSRHHMVALFSDITGRDMSFDETLAAIGEEGGLLTFAHPARSTEKNNNEVVHTGETFDLLENGTEELFYVCFLAHTSDFSIEDRQGALLGSQPFWILKN